MKVGPGFAQLQKSMAVVLDIVKVGVLVRPPKTEPCSVPRTADKCAVLVVMEEKLGECKVVVCACVTTIIGRGNRLYARVEIW